MSLGPAVAEDGGSWPPESLAGEKNRVGDKLVMAKQSRGYGLHLEGVRLHRVGHLDLGTGVSGGGNGPQMARG